MARSAVLQRTREGGAGLETLVAEIHVSDEVYKLARGHLDEKELVDLTMAVIAIDGWSRLPVAFRTVPGTYRPELSR